MTPSMRLRISLSFFQTLQQNLANRVWRGGRIIHTALKTKKMANTVRATNRLGGTVKRLKNKKNVVKQVRIYGRNGKPRVDIHYSNHGNKKMHPYNPHRHSWKNGKPTKGTKYPRYNRRFNWR